MDMTWNEILDLLQSYATAAKEDDDETMMHIENVLPDEIHLCEDGVHIVL